MDNKSKKSKSVAAQLTVTITIFVCIQYVLWIAALLTGGVLKTVREDAYQSLYDKVVNRRNVIQVEMKTRWMNLQLLNSQLSDKLMLLGNERRPDETVLNEFWKEMVPLLVSAMRTTMSTGAFIILNDNAPHESAHSAFYIRDYDPHLNDAGLRDICVAVGPGQLVRDLRLQLDTDWNYTLSLTDANRDFYMEPYGFAGKNSDAVRLGYWSTPFQLTPGDIEVITYSFPIFDRKGLLRGVAGIEISVDYFRELLPITELSSQDSLGYLLGVRYEGGALEPLLTGSAFQESMLRIDESFSLTPASPLHNVYLLSNHDFSGEVYACVEGLALYDFQTPFDSTQWYLIGLIEETELLSLYDTILQIIRLSFIFCLVLACVSGIFVSFRFTRPIRALAGRVRGGDMGQIIALGKTGFSEIDELSAAIETATKNFLETGAKMSRILELMNVPIGAFEYRGDIAIVFATDRLSRILSFTGEEAERLYSSRDLFLKKLEILRQREEPDEKHVYKISDLPDKWVKIEMAESDGTTLGIATDVTVEIREKRKLSSERDFDSLTGLRSREYFRRSVESVLSLGGIGVSAAVMLDLDAFKQVNDSYGHETGDAYLKALARILLEFETEQSVVGRRSGDEFQLFFYGFKSRDEIRERVKTIFLNAAERPFMYPDQKTCIIGFSAGICWLKNTVTDYDAIFRAADSALYRSKTLCKGEFCESESD